MYVITGATGNTGKPITIGLLKAGKKVRIISRSAEKAKELTDLGAELFIGDTTQTDVIKKALTGATALYAMIPIDWNTSDYTAHQVKHAQAIAEAVKYSGIKYLVSLSSIGAHLDKDSGVVLGLNKMENIFNQIEGLNILHLRPAYFMENSLGMIGLIKQAGIMGSPVKPSLNFPIIATKDIAEYALRRLLALDFNGKNIQNLVGSRNVSYQEIVQVYGKAIGKPDLNYVEFSYDDFKNSMVNQMGTSTNVADNFNMFIKSFNEGKVTEQAKRDAESTTPTSIEDFAMTFAHIYNM